MYGTDFSVNICVLSMKAVVSAFYFLFSLTLNLCFKYFEKLDNRILYYKFVK